MSKKIKSIKTSSITYKSDDYEFIRQEKGRTILIKPKDKSEGLIELRYYTNNISIEYEPGTPQIDLNKPLYLTEEPEEGQAVWVITPFSECVSRTWYEVSPETKYDLEYLFRANSTYPTKAHAQKALEIMDAVREFKRVCRENGWDYYICLGVVNRASVTLGHLSNDGLSNITKWELHGYLMPPTAKQVYREIKAIMADRLDLVLLQHLI